MIYNQSIYLQANVYSLINIENAREIFFSTKTTIIISDEQDDQSCGEINVNLDLTQLEI